MLAAARFLRVSLELVTTAYLMRMIGPGAFGLVAMATAVLAAFGAIGDAGVAASLVSDRDCSPGRITAAMVSSVALALATFAAAVLVTPAVVKFYHEPRLTAIWLITAVGLAFVPIGSTPLALLQREQRFGALAFQSVLPPALGAAIAIGMVQVVPGYWCLLAKQVATNLLAGLLPWLHVPLRFHRPSRTDFAELLRFARGVLGFDLLNVVSRNADNAIVGRWLGGQQLGLYSLSYRLLTVPLGLIGSVVGVVVYPRLCRCERERMGNELGRVIASVARFVTIPCFAIFLSAGELVLLLFGPEWVPSVPSVRWFALLGIYQAPFMLVGQAYRAARDTDSMARFALVSTPVIVASFFLGLPWGITGVAVSYASASLLLAYPLLRSVARVLGVNSWTLIAPTLRTLPQSVRSAAALLLVVFTSRALLLPGAVVVAAAGAGAVLSLFSAWKSEKRNPTLLSHDPAALALNAQATRPARLADGL